MILRRSEFKFLDRGFGKAMALLPGWATDHRIFSRLELDYNYLVMQNPGVSFFVQDLNNALRENRIEKISLFGYSMGGFLALDFAEKYPGKIEELNLVGIRKKYREDELDGVRRNLEKNKRAFLTGFYRDCFSDLDEGRLWFKNGLLRSYIEEMPLDELLDGLDYLQGASIRPEAINTLGNVRIFHGEEDRIAPFEEARALALLAPRARFIPLPKMGHIPFLNSGFYEKFNNR